MKKKIIVASVSALLIAAVLVMGTVAYLTAQSNQGEAIANTFVASDGLIKGTEENPYNPETPYNPDKPTAPGFFIVESDLKNPGKKTATGNEYTVLPAVNVKKDARLQINGKTELPGYVFLEVKPESLDSKLTYTITSDWKETSLTGKNGGKVYVYKEIVKGNLDAAILVNDEIVVDKDYTAKDGGKLSFYGYMCQEASFEAPEAAQYVASAEAAYTACFLPASN